MKVFFVDEIVWPANSYMCDPGHVLSHLCANMLIFNMGIMIEIHCVDLRITWQNESESIK